MKHYIIQTLGKIGEYSYKLALSNGLKQNHRLEHLFYNLYLNSFDLVSTIR